MTCPNRTAALSAALEGLRPATILSPLAVAFLNQLMYTGIKVDTHYILHVFLSRGKRIGGRDFRLMHQKGRRYGKLSV